MVTNPEEGWDKGVVCFEYCLAQLLGYPGIVWAAGHTEMHQATGIQLDDNEDEEGAEEEVIGLQEVNGPDVLGVVAQKRRPGLFAGQRTPDWVDVRLDGALGHRDAQLK